MPAKVTLQVTQGKLQGQEFVFDGRTTCIVGRADDCRPRLPNDPDHKTISRHHCLLDINPPDIRIRDFGSLNGTYVNGEKIGQRETHQTSDEGAQRPSLERDLKEGDEIKLDHTVFRVGIFVPTVCAGCSAEIPEDQKGKAERTTGVYECGVCRKTAETSPIEGVASFGHRICVECGNDVSAEMGEGQQGEFMCATCKQDTRRIINRLLEQAATGDEGLAALRGCTHVKRLGGGGMGAVHLLKQGATGELIALKVMLPRVATGQRAKRMFLREIQGTLFLRHPHVVRLRDAGCSQGSFFFTMEYCDGGSVRHLMKERGGRLSVDEAGSITLQALEGLEYAHNVYGAGNGLVHRDLKPDNLFLSGSGSARLAKVGDYGISKGFDSAGLSGLTATGDILGTPRFMPRQQVIDFKYARPEVDVWAMAASLYAMLTGCPPRHFPEGVDWWVTVLQSPAVPIRERNPSIPMPLADVIDLALVEEPQITFQTAAEFRQALERVL